MFIILNNGVSSSIGGPTHVPADMQVDYVHVYSHDPNAVAVAPEAGYSGPPTGGTPPPTGGFVGDANANMLMGDAGNNVLTGNGGNDTLNGNGGADTLVGGTGNDLYIVDNSLDVLNETGGGGIDTVQSSFSFNLNANGTTVLGAFENLTLTGSASTGTGNELANILVGNGASNYLYGNGGNDTIDGGGGNDNLYGGAGSDTFVRHTLSEGRDNLRGFQIGPGGDTLDIHDLLTGFNGTSNLSDFVHTYQRHGNTTVQVDPDGAANGHNYTSVAVLVGVTGVTVDQLVSNGNLDVA